MPSPARGTLAHAVFGGWSLDGFILARSARRLIWWALFSRLTALFLSAPGHSPGSSSGALRVGLSRRQGFDSAAFTAAPPGHQGFGRNVLRGFDATQADLGFQRVFRIERKRRFACAANSSTS